MRPSSSAQNQIRRKTLVKRNSPPLKFCKVDGCEMHHARLRRNGHFDTVLFRKDVLTHTQGYLIEYAPEHWLAKRKQSRYEYQHRIRFFDEHGEGPFDCNWCSCRVTWDDMHVDHLNSVEDDNRIENLVASCAVCNQQRGHEKVRESWRKKCGITFKGQTKTVSEWADVIGIARTALNFRLKAGWSIERALTEPRRPYASEWWTK